MDKLNGTIDLRLGLDEVNKINDLIKRDTPMPLVERQIVEGGHIYLECPVCGWSAGSYEFCPKCGQRLDTENIAL